jgi:CubicO group peptidase (beta-lactamase class C family)
MRGVAQLAAFVAAVEVASAFAGQTAVVRPDGSTITVAQVDQSANRLMQSAHVTGARIAIFHRGKIEYLKTYGARDAETGSGHVRLGERRNVPVRSSRASGGSGRTAFHDPI